MKEILAEINFCNENDSLIKVRDFFHIPKNNDKERVYFCGNSLGLQPKTASYNIKQELEDWANLGVEGHFKAKNPWLGYHKMFSKTLSKLVGGLEKEVVAMNALSVNLHLVLVSFYKPQQKRVKVLIEKNAFPSDYFVIASQMRFWGVNPEENIIESSNITEDIDSNKDSLALVMLGGVNYYSGQVFDMAFIASVCQKHQIIFGLDLAHAIGNVPLQLHNWNVDFAAWCSYKYLNSGPGSVSGIFIHEKHLKNTEINRLEGWWGTQESTRFLMKKEFQPIEAAESWQISNAPIFNMAAHKASLDIFEKVNLDDLRSKSLKMNNFIFQELQKYAQIKIITPRNEKERGCQISMYIEKDGKKLYDFLDLENIIADWREPNVIRIAPVPLYNTFNEVGIFLEAIKKFYSF